MSLTKCDIKDCEFPPFNDTGKWARIRAHYIGWYFSKDGTMIRCPIHSPEWLIKWRQRNELRKHGR